MDNFLQDVLDVKFSSKLSKEEKVKEQIIASSKKAIKTSAENSGWYIENDSRNLGWEEIGVPVLAYFDPEDRFVIGIYKNKGEEAYTIEIDGEVTSDTFETLRKPTAKSILRDPSFEAVTGLDSATVDVPPIPTELLDEVKTIESEIYDIVRDVHTFLMPFPYIDNNEKLCFSIESNTDGVPSFDAVVNENTVTLKSSDGKIHATMSSNEFLDFCSGYAEDSEGFVEAFMQRYDKQPAIKFFFGLDVSGLNKEPEVKNTDESELSASLTLTDVMTEAALVITLKLNEETDDVTGSVVIKDIHNNTVYEDEFTNLRMMKDVVSSFLDLAHPYDGNYMVNKLLKALR